MGRVEHQPRRRGCRGDAMEEKRGMKRWKQKRSVGGVYAAYSPISDLSGVRGEMGLSVRCNSAS